MPKTRLSLYYTATYLLFGGFGLLLTPDLTMVLLLSNVNYHTIIIRAVGMLFIGLGFLVVQIIRMDVRSLYPSVVLICGVYSVCLVAFYLMTLNPFFLTLLVIVIIGIVLTSWGLLADHNGSAE